MPDDVTAIDPDIDIDWTRGGALSAPGAWSGSALRSWRAARRSALEQIDQFERLSRDAHVRGVDEESAERSDDRGRPPCAARAAVLARAIARAIAWSPNPSATADAHALSLTLTRGPWGDRVTLRAGRGRARRAEYTFQFDRFASVLDGAVERLRREGAPLPAQPISPHLPPLDVGPGATLERLEALVEQLDAAVAAGWVHRE